MPQCIIIALFVVYRKVDDVKKDEIDAEDDSGVHINMNIMKPVREISMKLVDLSTNPGLIADFDWSAIFLILLGQASRGTDRVYRIYQMMNSFKTAVAELQDDDNDGDEVDCESVDLAILLEKRMLELQRAYCWARLLDTYGDAPEDVAGLSPTEYRKSRYLAWLDSLEKDVYHIAADLEESTMNNQNLRAFLSVHTGQIAMYGDQSRNTNWANSHYELLICDNVTMAVSVGSSKKDLTKMLMSSQNLSPTVSVLDLVMSLLYVSFDHVLSESCNCPEDCIDCEVLRQVTAYLDDPHTTLRIHLFIRLIVRLTLHKHAVGRASAMIAWYVMVAPHRWAVDMVDTFCSVAMLSCDRVRSGKERSLYANYRTFEDFTARPELGVGDAEVLMCAYRHTFDQLVCMLADRGIVAPCIIKAALCDARIGDLGRAYMAASPGHSVSIDNRFEMAREIQEVHAMHVIFVVGVEPCIVDGVSTGMCYSIGVNVAGHLVITINRLAFCLDDVVHCRANRHVALHSGKLKQFACKCKYGDAVSAVEHTCKFTLHHTVGKNETVPTPIFAHTDVAYMMSDFVLPTVSLLNVSLADCMMVEHSRLGLVPFASSLFNPDEAFVLTSNKKLSAVKKDLQFYGPQDAIKMRSANKRHPPIILSLDHFREKVYTMRTFQSLYIFVCI
jgi:hypothetical protein